jgi:hypothetical protein
MMTNQGNNPLATPDPADDPTDANPVPLSPTDPAHRTGEGDHAPTRPAFGVPLGAVPASSGGTGAVGGAPLAGILANEVDEADEADELGEESGADWDSDSEA